MASKKQNKKRRKANTGSAALRILIAVFVFIAGYYGYDFGVEQGIAPSVDEVVSAVRDQDDTTITENPVQQDDSIQEYISNEELITYTYTGQPYVSIGDGLADFSEQEIAAAGTSYEYYSDLDSLKRCGVTMASLSTETMPASGEQRGSISSVKPTGWIQKQYDASLISTRSLYNRAHLIGWQLSAENANKKNLITGTRYFNVDGMLPFENMVADYLKEMGEGYHVLYRVTPVFNGDELVARGVRMEAYSVEDQGDSVNYDVWCFNVQPGIEIDYATGDSWLAQ